MEGFKMKCQKCHFENREGVKFCEECGAKFEFECPVCKASIPLGRKFCGECGHNFKEPVETSHKDLTFDEKFSEAVAWGLAGRSPFDGGKAIKLKENNKRLRLLTDNEIKTLLAECTDHLKPIVSCAILTGMRRGEILSLKWDQMRNGFIYLSKTKTNEARQIPVSDSLEAVFREIRSKQGLRVGVCFHV